MKQGALLLLCWLTPLMAANLDDALALLRAGRWAEAETALTAVRQAEPSQLAALYYRARARAGLERWAAAVEDYREVLASKPDSLPSRLGLAEALERLGQLSEARAAYQAVLQAAPGHAEARAALERLASAAVARPPLIAVEAASGAPPALAPLAPPATLVGPHLAVAAEGADNFAGLLTATGLDAEGGQLLDYTFGSAPTDWEPTAGLWQVFSRFACDPTWSFFGGYSQGLAAIWNKRQFAGDIAVEAYVSFKHGLPWNPTAWSYRPADLCLTLCGDGANPASGYSFIYAGDEGSRTIIRRGAVELASTTEPRFLSPSYSDTRPATEEFHRRWWRLVARRAGDTLTLSIDGETALEVRDPEPLEGGRVALWTVHNGMMVARVRIAYEQELRALEPALVVTAPAPLSVAAR